MIVAIVSIICSHDYTRRVCVVVRASLVCGSAAVAALTDSVPVRIVRVIEMAGSNAVAKRRTEIHLNDFVPRHLTGAGSIHSYIRADAAVTASGDVMGAALV